MMKAIVRIELCHRLFISDTATSGCGVRRIVDGARIKLDGNDPVRLPFLFYNSPWETYVRFVDNALTKDEDKLGLMGLAR